MTGHHRLVEVAPERLERWVAGFAGRHGPPGAEIMDGVVVLSAPDGATASIEVPWPPAALDGDLLAAVATHAGAPRTALLVLVRRGGFAAGTARDGGLLDHATGTRHVQGRTAAGGWSQQRFARRRAGQATVLAAAAADLVARVLARAPAVPDVVVPGGDRALVRAVLADVRLAGVADLPWGPLLDVADPRLAVLQQAARRARAVRVRVEEP